MSDAAPSPDDDTALAEGGPSLAILKGVVWGLGLILLLGFGLVAALIVKGPTEDEGETTLPVVTLEEGERIGHATLEGDRLFLTVDQPDGTQRLLLIDLAGGDIAASDIRYGSVESEAATARGTGDGR